MAFGGILKLHLQLLVFIFSVVAFIGPRSLDAQQSDSEENVRIGIMGDSHGDLRTFGSALEFAAREGASHFIGTGDFVGFGGPTELERSLALIGRLTGIPVERTYLIPGNWEHETGYPIEEMNRVISRFGRLAMPKYYNSVEIQVGSYLIYLSHFPQFPIPPEMLPPPAFLKPIPGQAFVLDTINRKIYPSPAAYFGIFAHTHIAGVVNVAHTIAVNPGVLTFGKKSEDEVPAFAIFDSMTNQIWFYDAVTGSRLAEIPIKPLQGRCHIRLRDL